MSDLSKIHPWNERIWQHITASSERTNHALLFNGNHGLGKKDLAISFAHYLLCQNHGQSEHLFNAASHPDLHILMPEILAQEYQEQDDLYGKFAQRYLEDHSGKPKRVITIDQIRKLSTALTTHPHLSPIRVILIIDAHTLNINAANAILKNLEEPPANTLFILVSDELSKLSKTIRSRCSLINFRAPSEQIAKTWLTEQNEMPTSDIETYLAMSNGHPLHAIKLFKQNHIEALKTVFIDVNKLWNREIDPVQAAQNWHKIGPLLAIDILQKLVIDLLRNKLSNSQMPNKLLFYPVQERWVKSTSDKLAKTGLLNMFDELNYAKRMLSTTVDELLVLETVSNRLRLLPV